MKRIILIAVALAVIAASKLMFSAWMAVSERGDRFELWFGSSLLSVPFNADTAPDVYGCDDCNFAETTHDASSTGFFVDGVEIKTHAMGGNNWVCEWPIIRDAGGAKTFRRERNGIVTSSIDGDKPFKLNSREQRRPYRPPNVNAGYSLIWQIAKDGKIIRCRLIPLAEYSSEFGPVMGWRSVDDKPNVVVRDLHSAYCDL